MRVSCMIILVLAMFMTSTLAWPEGYEESDGEKNTISDSRLQYLLRDVNGIHVKC